MLPDDPPRVDGSSFSVLPELAFYFRRFRYYPVFYRYSVNVGTVVMVRGSLASFDTVML